MEVPKYKCVRCHYATDNRNHYVRHVNNKTPCLALYQDVPQSEMISLLTAEKEFKCPECTKSFAHLQNLSRHKKVHTREMPSPATESDTISGAGTSVIPTTDIPAISSATKPPNTVTIKNMTIQVKMPNFEDVSLVDTEQLKKSITEGITRGIMEAMMKQ